MNFYILLITICLIQTNYFSTSCFIIKKPTFALKTSIHICQICKCSEYTSINCLSQNSQTNSLSQVSSKLYLSFENVSTNLNQLFMDLDFFESDFDLNFDHNTFRHMPNLKILSLNLDKRVDLITMPNLKNSKLLEELTIQNAKISRITGAFCSNKQVLRTLDLSKNNFQTLAFIFYQCHSLYFLDLSYNRLSSLKHMFSTKNYQLHHLVLDYNRLVKIGQNDLKWLSNLVDLSLSSNQLYHIHPKAFDRMTKLQKLNLSRNRLISLPEQSPAYTSLLKLKINSNEDLIYFPGAEHFISLKEISVHYPYHCCQFKEIGLRQKKVIKLENSETRNNAELSQGSLLIASAYGIEQDKLSNDLELKILEKTLNTSIKYIWINKKSANFSCYPQPDAFTPCENLLEGGLSRVLVWLLALLGTMANISVIIYKVITSLRLYYFKREQDVPGFLLTNLALADSLMSIYLLFIAVKDLTSRGNFGQSALTWQRSASCNLAGFLSIVSYVSSSLCLAFITFERFYAIRNTIERIQFRTAFLVMTIIWLVAIFEASLPLFNLNNYSAYAICLPFDTRNRIFMAYAWSLNGLLISSFLFICTFYGLIFINKVVVGRKASMTSCSDKTGMRLRYLEDQRNVLVTELCICHILLFSFFWVTIYFIQFTKFLHVENRLARKISLLVFLNIVCWGPVVYLCFYSLVTNMSVINRTYLKVIAIIIMPFNSFLNPFMYCLTEKNFIQYIKRKYFSKS